jgi:hypothetical protein
MTRPGEKGCDAMEGTDFVRIEDILMDNFVRDAVRHFSEDAVNSPSHYNQGGIEAIEGIEASMAPEAYAGYLKGSVMKYLWRYEKKAKPIEDLKKARWFLDRLIGLRERKVD